MGVAVVAWLLAFVFGALVRARRRRAVLVPVAILLVLLAAACAFLAVLVAGFRCWDDCDEYSDKWWDSPDSWQWNGQLVPAAVGLVAVSLGLVFTIARRRGLALAAVATAAAGFSAWGLMLAPLA